MGEVIYGAFSKEIGTEDRIRPPKKRRLLNADWLWESKGWTYKLPHTNLPRRWEKEIAGGVIWAYVLERKGPYGRYTFEKRADAHERRRAGRKKPQVGV
jgi:hypothetical protein